MMLATAMEVDAVLATVRMPAEALATLSPGDRLDVAPHDGSPLLVRLMAAGETIAVASLEVAADGRLIATIINHGPGLTGNHGPGLTGRRIDQWKLPKAKTTA
jgi:hypothetical protein